MWCRRRYRRLWCGLRLGLRGRLGLRRFFTTKSFYGDALRVGDLGTADIGGDIIAQQYVSLLACGVFYPILSDDAYGLTASSGCH